MRADPDAVLDQADALKDRMKESGDWSAVGRKPVAGETFVDWRAVAANVAQSGEVPRSTYNRIVDAHTRSLSDAFDALPPGAKARLMLLEAEVARLAKLVDAQQPPPMYTSTPLAKDQTFDSAMGVSR